MDSSQSQNTKIVNSTSHLPDIDNYVAPLVDENYKSVSKKLEAILKLFKTKIDEKSAIIITKGEEISITDEYFQNIKRTTQYEDLQEPGKNYNFILDAISFHHRQTDLSENQQQIPTQKIDRTTLKNILSSLSDKGMAMFVMDFHFLIQVPDVLKEYIVDEKESNVNILTRVYVIEKLPLVGVLTVQKFEKSHCDFNSLKLLTYEMYEDFSITKPVSYLLTLLKKSLTYMYEMFQYQGYLTTLTPGNVVKISVRENFWSDNVDYTITVVDSNNPELIKRKSCVAIIVTKSYANDFIYLTQEGNMQLCQQVGAARIILIRPNAFNFASVDEIKDKISHYISLFRNRDSSNIQTPIMLMSDNKNESYEVYKENSFMVRDIIENEKKETFRQLIFNEHQSEIQSEVKLVLTTKSKAKSDPENYTILPTIQKYKEKHLVSCLDQNFICSFYIKTVLTGIFFINSEKNFPEKNLEVLILGAGIGTINFFFNKIFGSKVNITAVELDKKMAEIGEKYFGFINSQVANCKWHFGDAKDFLLESAKNNNNEKKYDMVITDINNFDSSEGISPPPVFFNEETLNSVKVIYQIYIMHINFIVYS
jgi:hypothetical protein